MPNIKSAAKRARTSAVARIRNRATKSEILSLRKMLDEALGGTDKDKAEAAYRRYVSELDKSVKRGIVPANTASRKKARGAAALKRKFETAS